MAGSFQEFSAALDKFVDEIIPRDYENVVKKTAFKIYDSVTVKSPVDTGRFRGNWNVALDVKSGAVDYSLSYADWPASDQAARQSINAFTIKNNGIWISNNLPYARRLEFGWSKQAPAGMVRITMIEVQSWLSAGGNIFE